METKWNVSEIPSVSSINEMSEALKISKLLSVILCVRGFTVKSASDFLNKDLSCIYDPYLLKDMDKGVKRIRQALCNNEIITVYGDYDADGVTSCSLLVKALKKLNGNVNYYIPERETEGYGINNSSIEHIKNRGTSLIITVDCGITAISECEYAKSLGIDMVITDHHECSDSVPEAVAVIDAKQKDCEYPFKHLAGVGVAFKLVQALFRDTVGTEELIDEYSDLVTIGSIADIVPLVGENRVICHFGLKSISNTKNQGIRALVDVSGLDINKIDATKIGFVIAPKINAVGRLEDATRAIKLFLSEDYDEAYKIASELHGYNKMRQEIETEILEEADKQLKKYYLNDKIAVLDNKNWHHGVVGIVASRLTKRYFKPCIMISPGTEGLYKGSGRSISGFSLYDALDYSKDTLKSFGGHELAAGLVIEKNNIQKFRKKINEYAEKNMSSDILVNKITADCELRGRHLNLASAEELSKLQPYGTENAQPVFYIKNMTVANSYKIGNNKQHLRLQLIKDGVKVDAVAFGMGDRNITFNSVISVMCNLDVNEFRNERNLQLKIIDIK